MNLTALITRCDVTTKLQNRKKTHKITLETTDEIAVLRKTYPFIWKEVPESKYVKLRSSLFDNRHLAFSFKQTCYHKKDPLKFNEIYCVKKKKNLFIIKAFNLYKYFFFIKNAKNINLHQFQTYSVSV